MELITRKEALKIGSNRYFTGKPCKKGHLSYKRVHNRDCVECAKDYQKKYKQTDKYKASGEAYRKTDEHKIYQRAYQKDYQKTNERKTWRKEYIKTELYKEAEKRTKLKFPNALKSRKYYRNHKHKISVLDSCEKCNSTNRIQAHHHDYNLPLDVTYLCSQCHSNWHMVNTPVNREEGIFTKKSADN